MTGPLAEQFAQVRDIVAEMGSGDRTPEEYDVALAALSVIERHVQDMETALREARELSDANPTLGGRFKTLRDALAALPAREKEEE